MVRARLSWLVTHRPVRCKYKTEPILACSALPRRRRSAIASAERNDRASQGVGRISASKLRFASAVEVPSKATEIWTSVGSWVWLRVARRQPAILLRWPIAIATMTTVRSSRCRRGGSQRYDDVVCGLRGGDWQGQGSTQGALSPQRVPRLDNLNTHKKNENWLARHPLVTFHYTPTRASWLNHVEGWFSILQGQSLTGASPRQRPPSWRLMIPGTSSPVFSPLVVLAEA